MRLEIPEHDPLFLNTDLVSSRGLCWRQISILKQNLLANFAELQVWATDIATRIYVQFVYSWSFFVLFLADAHVNISLLFSHMYELRFCKLHSCCDILIPDPEIFRSVEASKEEGKFAWQSSSASLDSSPFFLPCFGLSSTSGSPALMLSFRYWIIWRTTKKNLTLWAFRFTRYKRNYFVKFVYLPEKLIQYMFKSDLCVNAIHVQIHNIALFSEVGLALSGNVELLDSLFLFHFSSTEWRGGGEKGKC